MRLFEEVTVHGHPVPDRQLHAGRDYLLSSVQAGKTFPTTETDDYYAVESNFALPYIPCVMDEVAWTPGTTNKGWAIGTSGRPRRARAEERRRATLRLRRRRRQRIRLFTYTPIRCPATRVGHSGFQPTLGRPPRTEPRTRCSTSTRRAPTNTASRGRATGWAGSSIFGLFVDPKGVVYVPKRAPPAIPGWDTYDECVTINLADAPVPTTRTQFPGNESYYAAETFIPGYAAPPGIGDRHWGQKGRPMSEVAIWEDSRRPTGLNSPGNYHKPYEGGCDTKGYNFTHAAGFTWPALRQHWTAHGDIPTKEAASTASPCTKVAGDGTTTPPRHAVVHAAGGRGVDPHRDGPRGALAERQERALDHQRAHLPRPRRAGRRRHPEPLIPVGLAAPGVPPTTLRRMRGWIAPALALAVSLSSATLAAEEPWKTQTTKGALTLERRPVASSSYYEYRVKTESPAPPKGVIDGLWSGFSEDLPAAIAKREIVSRSDSEIVVYDQIKSPVLSDRDMVLRIRRVTRVSGTIEVSFQTTDQVGPPPNPKMVRIPVVRGGWIIGPSGERAMLTYTCYSEPGGSVPAILVRGAQEDQVFLDVQRILRRARR